MHQNGASSSNGAGLEADRGASGGQRLRVLGRHRMCRTVRVQDVLDHSHPQSRNRQRRWYRGGFRKKTTYTVAGFASVECKTQED